MKEKKRKKRSRSRDMNDISLRESNMFDKTKLKNVFSSSSIPAFYCTVYM